jgi:hypothetical protein
MASETVCIKIETQQATGGSILTNLETLNNWVAHQGPKDILFLLQ